jgi:hypothetical protein
MPAGYFLLFPVVFDFAAGDVFPAGVGLAVRLLEDLICFIGPPQQMRSGSIHSQVEFTITSIPQAAQQNRSFFSTLAMITALL